MAADGSKGPRPFTQRQARTLFVRVPAVDWPEVKRGFRRTFVGSIGRQSALFQTQTPVPVVAYAIIRGSHDSRLMILDGLRQEPLGAIPPQELGFPSMAEFRRYWMTREHRKFPPTRKVFVYTVRPYEPEDREEIGAVMFDRLYGAFLR